MTPFRKFSLTALTACALVQMADASIVISIYMDRLDTAQGTPIAVDTLMQLVNLGPNGVFDPIDVDDGSSTGLERWTSGDDTVVDSSFSIGVGINSIPGDFLSTAAFDLTSYTATNADGIFDRAFEFGVLGPNILAPGTKLGIRWFPGFKAADFYSQEGITLTACQRYGEFTRQTNLKFGGTPWIVPLDGSSFAFDALLTADGATPPPDSDSGISGDANLGPLGVCPEPAALGLSLIGAACLGFHRRRRR